MGMIIEVKKKMNANQYCQILGDRMVESFEKLEIVEVSNIFSRAVIQNTPPRRPHNCFETIIYNFYYGQPSLQTLITLNTYGNMSNDKFPSIKLHLKEYMNCGIDWLMSGMELHQKYVKIS